MKAMILAAGRGKRMRQSSSDLPKALLDLNGLPLIAHRIISLVAAGITEIIINVYQDLTPFKQLIGDGDKFNCRILYSLETEILETAGGIIKALPLLGDKPFINCSCDTVSNYNFTSLIQHTLDSHTLAHLVLVDNPQHHHRGDFSLEQTRVCIHQENAYNYAGFSLLHPKLFDDLEPGYRKVGDVLKSAVQQHLVSGEVFNGTWVNADTPERLAIARKQMQSL